MTKFTNRKEIRYVCGNRLGFHIFIISACSRNVKYILTKIRSCARQLFARCRGGDSRARRRTPDPYRLSLKWHAPIASVAALSERHAGQQHVAHGFCGVTPPELSLRGCFAPVAISQYLARLWESCRRNRNCLHEIATSASGLLAMTNLWPSLFYRQPVRIGSNAPGPAVRSPACQKSPFGPFSPSCFQNCKIEYCSILFCNSAVAAGD